MFFFKMSFLCSQASNMSKVCQGPSGVEKPKTEGGGGVINTPALAYI
jgi:hypothetical protein